MVGQAAQNAASALARSSRQRITKVAGQLTTPQPPVYLHVGVWSPPKMRKTSLGLRATSSEIRLPGKVDVNFEEQPGEVLLPAKPLTIGFANFDRDARTVLADIPGDFDILEERLFEGPEGAPLVLGGPAAYQAIIDRFLDFCTEVEKANEFDLMVVDGGTILWENVRAVLLDPVAPAGKTPEGDARHLPRQYGPSNKYMREQVMQRLYNLPMHTLITRESRERWAGQNEPLKDDREVGGIALQSDGWGKTGHYLDVDMQMRLVKNPGQPEMPQGIIHMAIKASTIGTTMRDPTFARLYSVMLGRPLIKRGDEQTFLELQQQHGAQLRWD